MTMDQQNAERMGRALAGAIHEHWGLFLAEGIILVILGIAAIALPPIATLAFTIIIGWVFLISGVVGLFTTFWARHVPGFWWSLISAIIGIAAGVVLLLWPITGTLSLTLVLIAFFVIEGIVSIMYAIEHRNQLTGPLGLDAGERHHRPHPRRHHLCRAAGNGGLGARPLGRHQYAVRRRGADRDGARGAAPGLRLGRPLRGT